MKKNELRALALAGILAVVASPVVQTTDQSLGAVQADYSCSSTYVAGGGGGMSWCQGGPGPMARPVAGMLASNEIVKA
jgi:hypothetical protein